MDPVFEAGVDEAGRGCLAGPVYAAAVVLKPRTRLPGLGDSKVLTARRRECLAPLIRQRAVAFAVAFASVEEIERLNILNAALLAMRRAVEVLQPQPARALVDGNRAPVLDIPVQTVVDGDAKIRAIMAASILAKVARDAEMQRLEAEHPGYGFARHKGYGTASHFAALQKLGPCSVRRGFMPVMQAALPLELRA